MFLPFTSFTICCSFLLCFVWFFENCNMDKKQQSIDLDLVIDWWPVFCFCFQSFTGSALAALVKGLPEALQRQYEYEDPIVRGGKQLLHSPFFKVCSHLFPFYSTMGWVCVITFTDDYMQSLAHVNLLFRFWLPLRAILSWTRYPAVPRPISGPGSADTAPPPESLWL